MVLKRRSGALNNSSNPATIKMDCNKFVTANFSPTSQALVKYFYIKDHLGSTCAVMNTNGAVVESYDYYPFGLKMPGLVYPATPTITKNLFTGKELDGETGWFYFGARPYLAHLGRWPTVDPMSEFEPGISPFHYVRNDPISRFDPDGMQDTIYTVQSVIVEALRYIPSRYDLYYDAAIGSPFGTGSRYRRAEPDDDLRVGINYGLTMSFAAMSSGNTIYSGLQLGRRGVASSPFKRTFCGQ